MSINIEIKMCVYSLGVLCTGCLFAQPATAPAGSKEVDCSAFREQILPSEQTFFKGTMVYAILDIKPALTPEMQYSLKCNWKNECIIEQRKLLLPLSKITQQCVKNITVSDQELSKYVLHKHAGTSLDDVRQFIDALWAAISEDVIRNIKINKTLFIDERKFVILDATEYNIYLKNNQNQEWHIRLYGPDYDKFPATADGLDSALNWANAFIRYVDKETNGRKN